MNCEIKNNLSQEELAEVLDVSRQSISKWENDKGYPEMTRLLFMSDYFDVSLDYLMRGIKKENNEEKVTADDADKISNDKYKTKNILLVWNNFSVQFIPKSKDIIYVAVYLDYLLISRTHCKCNISRWLRNRKIHRISDKMT